MISYLFCQLEHESDVTRDVIEDSLEKAVRVHLGGVFRTAPINVPAPVYVASRLIGKDRRQTDFLFDSLERHPITLALSSLGHLRRNEEVNHAKITYQFSFKTHVPEDIEDSTHAIKTVRSTLDDFSLNYEIWPSSSQQSRRPDIIDHVYRMTLEGDIPRVFYAISRLSSALAPLSLKREETDFSLNRHKDFK